MVFVLLGSNYNDIPLEELESLERHTDQIRKALLGSVSDQSAITGGVLIGTCNRFEVYLDTDHFHEAVEQTIRVVSQVSGLDADYCSKILHVSYGSAVAQHLYSVASGLESMIVGEGEIAGQVRRSLADAQADKQVTAPLQRLFQSASAVAKRVANQTGLGVAGRSIVGAGIDLFEASHGSIAGSKALIIGTGAYARVVVAALQRAGCTDVSVYSNSGRAKQFSEGHNTKPITDDELLGALAEARLVITASGNRTHAIDYKLAKQVLDLRAANQSGPLSIIDVALAASVAPPVYDLPQVEIMDLDYIRMHTPVEHSEAILAAQELVHEAVNEFEAEQTARQVDPMITALRAHVGVWVEEEVDRVRKKSGEEAAAEVARSLNRVTNALLHTPSVNAKSLAKSGNHQDYLDAVKTLFNIDLSALGDGDA